MTLFVINLFLKLNVNTQLLRTYNFHCSFHTSKKFIIWRLIANFTPWSWVRSFYDCRRMSLCIDCGDVSCANKKLLSRKQVVPGKKYDYLSRKSWNSLIHLPREGCPMGINSCWYDAVWKKPSPQKWLDPLLLYLQICQSVEGFCWPEFLLDNYQTTIPVHSSLGSHYRF